MTVIDITRGSDARIDFDVTDSSGAPLSVTDVIVLENSIHLNGRLEIIERDFSQGEFTVKIEGSSPIATGVSNFRWQAELSSGDTLGSPEIKVNVV